MLSVATKPLNHNDEKQLEPSFCQFELKNLDQVTLKEIHLEGTLACNYIYANNFLLGIWVINEKDIFTIRLIGIDLATSSINFFRLFECDQKNMVIVKRIVQNDFFGIVIKMKNDRHHFKVLIWDELSRDKKGRPSAILDLPAKLFKKDNYFELIAFPTHPGFFVAFADSACWLLQTQKAKTVSDNKDLNSGEYTYHVIKHKKLFTIKSEFVRLALTPENELAVLYVPHKMKPSKPYHCLPKNHYALSKWKIHFEQLDDEKISCAQAISTAQTKIPVNRERRNNDIYNTNRNDSHYAQSYGVSPHNSDIWLNGRDAFIAHGTDLSLIPLDDPFEKREFQGWLSNGVALLKATRPPFTPPDDEYPVLSERYVVPIYFWPKEQQILSDTSKISIIGRPIQLRHPGSPTPTVVYGLESELAPLDSIRGNVVVVPTIDNLLEVYISLKQPYRYNKFLSTKRYLLTIKRHPLPKSVIEYHKKQRVLSPPQIAHYVTLFNKYGLIIFPLTKLILEYAAYQVNIAGNQNLPLLDYQASSWNRLEKLRSHSDISTETLKQLYSLYWCLMSEIKSNNEAKLLPNFSNLITHQRETADCQLCQFTCRCNFINALGKKLSQQKQQLDHELRKLEMQEKQQSPSQQTPLLKLNLQKQYEQLEQKEKEHQKSLNFFKLDLAKQTQPQRYLQSQREIFKKFIDLLNEGYSWKRSVSELMWDPEAIYFYALSANLLCLENEIRNFGIGLSINTERNDLSEKQITQIKTIHKQLCCDVQSPNRKRYHLFPCHSYRDDPQKRTLSTTDEYMRAIEGFIGMLNSYPKKPAKECIREMLLGSLAPQFVELRLTEFQAVIEQVITENNLYQLKAIIDNDKRNEAAPNEPKHQSSCQVM